MHTPKKREAQPTPQTESRNGTKIVNMDSMPWTMWNPQQVEASKRFWAPCLTHYHIRRDITEDYDAFVYIKAFGDWDYTTNYDRKDDKDVQTNLSDTELPGFEGGTGVEEKSILPVTRSTGSVDSKLNEWLDLVSVYVEHFLGLFRKSQWFNIPIIYNLIDNHFRDLRNENKRSWAQRKKDWLNEMNKMNENSDIYNNIWQFYLDISLQIEGISGKFHSDENTNLKYYLVSFLCIMRVQMYKIGYVTNDDKNSALSHRLGQYRKANSTMLKVYCMKDNKAKNKKAKNKQAIKSIEKELHIGFAKLGYMTCKGGNKNAAAKIFTNKNYEPREWSGKDGQNIRTYFEYVYGLDNSQHGFIKYLMKQCDKYVEQSCEKKQITVKSETLYKDTSKRSNTIIVNSLKILFGINGNKRKKRKLGVLFDSVLEPVLNLFNPELKF